LLKGLILRQEGDGREERGMRIGLQYYEQRRLRGHSPQERRLIS